MQRVSLFFLILICLTDITIAGQKSKNSTPLKSGPLKKNVRQKTLKLISSKNLKIPFEINYGSYEWNHLSTKLDVTSVFIRDKNTGKIAKTLLSETEPDSAIFSGKLWVNWKQKSSISPEIYIPTNSRKIKQIAKKDFATLLKMGHLKKKPLLFKKYPSGNLVIDVYDTKKQVQKAKKHFKSELALKKQLEESKKTTPESPNSHSRLKLLEAQRLAKKQALIEKAQQISIDNENFRLREEQLERQKIILLIKKQSHIKKNGSTERALSYLKKGQAAYKINNFKKAEKYFKKSFQLDPNNDSYRFKYAVSLYRNQKLNKALIMLKLSNPSQTEKIEKQYYLGLIYYRIGEFKNALKKFRLCKLQNHTFISPSSAFYEGRILYALEKFEQAKAPFEFVLEHSKDPKLDQKAEDYLEKIALQQAYLKRLEHRHDLSMTTGFMYDSNVLLTASSAIAQGNALSVETPRVLLTSDYNYQIVYNRKNEFSLKASTQWLYSIKDEGAFADPLVVGVTAPYTVRGRVLGLPHQFTSTLGFETIYLPISTAAVRENLFNSVTLNFKSTFFMSRDWIAGYELKLRNDDSQLIFSDPSDESDAQLFSFETTQSFFADYTKKEGHEWKLGYTQNEAQGENKKYSRIDLGVTYFSTLSSWNATWYSLINLYHLTFQGSNPHADLNSTVLIGVKKPHKKWINYNFSASYTDSSSDVTTFTYDKYVVSMAAEFNWNF